MPLTPGAATAGQSRGLRREKESPLKKQHFGTMVHLGRIQRSSVPSNALFMYQWRVPFDVNMQELDDDEMCTKQWTPGKVTKIISKHTVDVNGVPRHVRDVRRRPHGRTIDVNRRPLRAVETDPSVQGDEGPGMLEMLETCLLRTVGLVGYPSSTMVMLSSRRGAPMSVPGCLLRARETRQQILIIL